MERYDVVVLGGGLNGLSAALSLSSAGLKTLVLEKNPQLGGLAAPVEFAEGFFAPGLLPDRGWVRSGVLDRLGLTGAVPMRGSARTLLCAHKEGHIALSGDLKQTQESIAVQSQADAGHYGRYCELMSRQKQFLSGIFNEIPPSLGEDAGVSDLWSLFSTGFSLRRMSHDDMFALLRTLPMCLRDFLGDWFETPALKAGLALPALFGSYVGPWAPSTSSLLLFDAAATQSELKGSVRTLLDSLKEKCVEQGVEVRTSCAFEQILLEAGRVCGVRVQGGEEFSTGKVLSTLDPKTTILDGFEPGYVPFKMRQSMTHVRSRGVTSVLMFALDGMPAFQDAVQGVERFCVAEDLASIEKCFDAPKYGALPEKYVLEGALPSCSDAGLAPQGKHVMQVWVHGTGKEVRGGWSRENRETVIQGVVGRIDACAPGFAEKVVASELFTPEDIESKYGVRGGHLLHVEPALDQVWSFRPTIHCSRYQTPIEGLFLGGSGSHPGGGVSLAPGALAAKALLQ